MITIRIISEAMCDVCGYQWAPTMWIGMDNVSNSLPLECPKCKEAKREAGRMIRHFDPVEDLLG
jgi:hypothetical protein